jgi:hypothetical protein
LLRQHSEFEFRNPSKIINGRHTQRGGQQILARSKIYIKKITMYRENPQFGKNLRTKKAVFPSNKGKEVRE